MEKKEKPKVPAKPRNSSVTETVRNFDRLVAEVTEAIASKTIATKSIKISKSESDIDNASTQNATEVSINAVQIEDADKPDIATHHSINGQNEVDDSSDDSIYFGAEEFGENIYDEIAEPTGVTNTVDEILSVEEHYIDKLRYTIDNYVQPLRLLGDPFIKAVFGNIEEIKQFHEDIFYPNLKKCNKELVRILECFSFHISAGHFYVYVVYAMNKKRSDEERNKPAYKSVIEERQHQIGDKLGLGSGLTEPFQLFFKYQNLIESFLKKIKDNEPNFMEVAATSKALHDVKKLLNTANKSMALTEIVDSKINLMNQGNFLTQNEFNIFDHNHKRKYKGNIFVFQHCVVCTERISATKLQFKAYFPNGTSHTECIDENKFLLYERNNYKIEISSDANRIQQMLKQVRQVLSNNGVKRSSVVTNVNIVESKVPIKESPKELVPPAESLQKSASFDSLNFLSDIETATATTSTTNLENRKSNSSAESADYGEYHLDEYNVKQPFREIIKNIDKFYERTTNKTPTCTVHREEINRITLTVHQTSTEIMQEMLSNEKEYIRQLTAGIQTYLNHDIAETIKGKIIKIFGNMQQIRDFHQNTFQLTLSECQNDVTKIANVFIKYTQEGLFSNYILYAMNHSNTQSMCSMRPYREYFELRQKDAEDNRGVEYYLFLPLQHLSKYEVFMDRIIHTLNIDNETAAMASCSKAVKNVERLIKDVQSSWTLSNTQVRKRPMRKFSSLVLNGIQNIRRN